MLWVKLFRTIKWYYFFDIFLKILNSWDFEYAWAPEADPKTLRFGNPECLNKIYLFKWPTIFKQNYQTYTFLVSKLHTIIKYNALHVGIGEGGAGWRILNVSLHFVQ